MTRYTHSKLATNQVYEQNKFYSFVHVSQCCTQHTTSSAWNASQALLQAEHPTLYVVLADNCFHLQSKHTHAHIQQ